MPKFQAAQRLFRQLAQQGQLEPVACKLPSAIPGQVQKEILLLGLDPSF
jgi:hypothetical protein